MPQSNFKYDKETLFKEFKVAKEADMKLSKKKTISEKETDIYKNRIQFFKDHIKLKSTNPEVYDLSDPYAKEEGYVELDSTVEEMEVVNG